VNGCRVVEISGMVEVFSGVGLLVSGSIDDECGVVNCRLVVVSSSFVVVVNRLVVVDLVVISGVVVSGSISGVVVSGATVVSSLPQLNSQSA